MKIDIKNISSSHIEMKEFSRDQDILEIKNIFRLAPARGLGYLIMNSSIPVYFTLRGRGQLMWDREVNRPPEDLSLSLD